VNRTADEDAGLSTEEFRVLRGIGFSGVVETADELHGIEFETDQLIEGFRQRDLVTGEGFLMLTTAGEDLLAQWYQGDRKNFGPEDADRMIDDFRPVDLEVKRLSSEWQAVNASGPDARLDVLVGIKENHQRALSFLDRYGTKLPRLSEYTDRLDAAIDRISAGDENYFVGVTVDSYHTIWFHLHEDILRVLARTRDVEE
jgi:hypothetical protein